MTIATRDLQRFAKGVLSWSAFVVGYSLYQ
jgi:hypothetical protein